MSHAIFNAHLFSKAGPEHNSNVTCYFPDTSTTYANVDHTTNNTQL